MVYKLTYSWGPHPVWKTTLCYPLFMGKRSVNGPLSIAVFFRCSQRIFETLSAGTPQDGLVISTLNNNPRWGPHRPPIWRWRRRSFDYGSNTILDTGMQTRVQRELLCSWMSRTMRFRNAAKEMRQLHRRGFWKFCFVIGLVSRFTSGAGPSTARGG